jgi:hypothetical protein
LYITGGNSSFFYPIFFICIATHIIEATEKAFDDFAGADIDQEHLKKIIGLS